MSSREDQVLERQRQMANRLSQRRAASGGAASTSPNRQQQGGNKPRPPPPPGGPPKPPGGALARARSNSGSGGGGSNSRSLASLMGVPSKPKPSTMPGKGAASATQKRPALKRPHNKSANEMANQKRPSAPVAVDTPEMALYQARQRAGIEQPELVKPRAANAQKRPTRRRNPSASLASTTSSSSVAKKSSGAGAGGGGGGSLSSLLLSNTSTAKYLQPNAPKMLKHYRKIEPNDYWKNMRSWDFLQDLNDKAGNNNQKQNGNNNNVKRKRDDNNNNNNEQPQQQPQQNLKPIPEKFDSYREYCHLWSPLCLSEARAQLLAEAVSNIPYWKSKPEKKPLRVRLLPCKKDVNGSSESMGVQIKEVLGDNYDRNKDRGCMTNDLVLLVKSEDCIWDASKGKLYQNQPSSSKTKRFGIVGNIEYNRRSMEGLTIQVSRALWAEMGTNALEEELVLLKLGCNITALREFTALARMDSIPLLDYILGSKMSSSKKSAESLTGSTTDDLDDVDPTTKEKRAKKEILSKMGGSHALGQGFAKYASQKFNLSQLGAISASATEYGDGGFTLIKGPPGTGKTTTLCALLNALHIRQMNQYFEEVKKLAESFDAVVGKRASLSLSAAKKKRPRILVCAPSNAAVDNVILKIMEDGFVDGNGCRYNPSIARIGRGQSAAVKDVGLDEKIESYISDAMDYTKLENTIEGYKAECRRIHADITKLRQRMNAIKKAAPYPLAKDWEIRVDEDTARVFFVNHKEKMTSYEVPPPPEPGQRHFPPEAMPEYKAFVTRVVKMVERYNGISTKLERYSLCRDVSNAVQRGANSAAMNTIRQQVETHILDESIHIVTTTLGTAGNRSLEAANKFEVVVIDEAAQSVEPSTLAGLQLGSSHAILVGDPQQLPATIFNVSGRNTKYDRSLFQRLEEAGHDVHLLDTQYRMNPAISDFPRRIFYDGRLKDGINVLSAEYGNPLKKMVFRKFPAFQPFTVLDLESSEERGGTSLANTAEAQLALHLFNNLKLGTNGQSTSSRVAVITPYAQQAALLRRTFSAHLGPEYERFAEISSVDAFQGREANIVIFSCVRAAGSRGIGFLSDVRRMNVALTRAKHFLFVIARCSSITVNPYWRDLVENARETEAVIKVPFNGSRGQGFSFPDLWTLKAMPPLPPPKPQRSTVPAADRKKCKQDSGKAEHKDNSGSRGYSM